MSNLQLRKEVRDGVEFFVSNDGEQVGMSALGLSVLCGVHSTAIDTLVKTYKNLSKLPSKKLEAIRDNGYKILAVPAANVEGGRGKDTNFIPAEICAGIVKYYAFESKNVSTEVKEKSEYAFDQFTAIGIKTWILQVVGYSEQRDNNQVIGLLQQLMLKVENMEVKLEEYNNIRKVTISSFPGMDGMLDDLSQTKALPPADTHLTLKEWLSDKGISLDNPAMHRLANEVASTYRTLTHKEPRKIYRKNRSGKLMGNYLGYHPTEFFILEQAFKKVVG